MMKNPAKEKLKTIMNLEMLNTLTAARYAAASLFWGKPWYRPAEHGVRFQGISMKMNRYSMKKRLVIMKKNTTRRTSGKNKEIKSKTKTFPSELVIMLRS